MSSSSIIDRENFDNKQMNDIIDEVIRLIDSKTIKSWDYGRITDGRPINIGEAKEVLNRVIRRIEFRSNIRSMLEIFPNGET